MQYLRQYLILRLYQIVKLQQLTHLDLLLQLHCPKVFGNLVFETDKLLEFLEHMPTYQVFYDLKKYYQNLTLIHQVKIPSHYLFVIELVWCFQKILYNLKNL